MTRLIVRRRVLGAVISLLMIANGARMSVGQTAPAPALEPKAQKVLKSIADVFKSADSTSFTMITRMKAQGRGMHQEMENTQSISLQKPNKLAVTVKEGMQDATVISDGENLYVHIPVFNKYSQEPAPKDLAELSENPIVMEMTQFGAVVIQLFGGMEYDQIFEGVKEIRYVGQEQLDGKDVHHLKIMQEGMDMELWASSGEQPLPLKVKPDLSRQFAQQNMADIEVNFEIVLSDWKFNEPSVGQAFAFVPPAGAQKVETAMDILGGGSEAAEALKGKPAPAFELELLNGGKFDLAQHLGKEVVLLEFWATWCPPCIEGLPIVDEIARSYADRGLVFCTINEREDEPKIQKFLNQHKLDLKVALDKRGRVGADYGMIFLPQTVVIGKDGKVAAVHVGLPPNLKQQLIRELDQALGEKAQ